MLPVILEINNKFNPVKIVKIERLGDLIEHLDDHLIETCDQLELEQMSHQLISGEVDEIDTFTTTFRIITNEDIDLKISQLKCKIPEIYKEIDYLETLKTK